MKESINLFDEEGWQPAKEYPENTRKKILREKNGEKTILLNLPKNFSMPAHSHIAGEQHIVLKGSYKSDGEIYETGTYRTIEPHANHGPFESEEGALVLVIWNQV